MCLLQPIRLVIALSLLPLVSGNLLATGLAERNRVEDAMALGLPALAVEKAEAALRNGSVLGDEERRAIKRRLLEAYVRSGAMAKALKLGEDSDIDDKTKGFWCGQAWLAQGEHERALDLLSNLAEDQRSPFGFPAAVTVSILRGRMGDTDRALSLLESWSQNETYGLEAIAKRLAITLDAGFTDEAIAILQEASRYPVEAQNAAGIGYYEARLAYLLDQFDVAMRKCEQLIAMPRVFDEIFLHQAYLLQAQIWHDRNAIGNARAVLIRFLDTFPSSALIPQAFEMLSETRGVGALDVASKWDVWARVGDSNFRLYAAYYAAKHEWEQGNEAEALGDLSAIEVPKDHPLYVTIFLDRLDWALALREPDKALDWVGAVSEVAKDWASSARCRLYQALASAYYQKGVYARAAEFYGNLAMEEANKPEAAVTARYNQALAAFRAGDDVQFVTCLAGLSQFAQTAGSNEGSNLAGEALLATGRALARDPATLAQAKEMLQRFINDHTNHPEVTSGRISLAEVAMILRPREFELAKQMIEAIRQSGPAKVTTAQGERVDYIELWVASEEEDQERVLALGEQFLEKHPNSLLLPKIRLKRAEAYFATQRFANAMGELAFLEQEGRGSAILNQAHFLKATAALYMGSLDEAVKMWGELVDTSTGEERLVARYQQALALCQQDKRKDALAQFNAIIAAQPSDELLFRTLSAKAECLTVVSEQEGQWNNETVDTLMALINHPRVTPFWRDQAYYRKGLYHLRNGDAQAASSALGAVLEHYRDGKTLEKASAYWYYMAGFKKIEILESQKNWAGAAALATELGGSSGDRAEEANRLAERIKNEHWLY